MDMNKPVACVYQQFGIGRVAWISKIPPDGTPLYTHPVKELTDEEIIAEAEKFGVIIADTGLKAIKAILRKAQEK